MFYVLTEYLINERLLVLAEYSLSYLTNTETSETRFLFNQGQIAYWKKEYGEAITHLNKLLDLEQRHDSAWVLKGNAHFFMGSGYDAEECYLNALKSFVKPKKGSGTMISRQISPERVTPQGTTVSQSSLTTVGLDYSIH
jgi:tetratricopeptide (TPR) repeat protein